MHPKLREAVRLFNRREYFSCHQILEEGWSEIAAEDQAFYEALIRFATALHLRFNRGASQGTINLLTQGLMRLESYRPSHHGVNVARLYTEVDTHAEHLKTVTKDKPGFFERWRVPRIYYTDD
jgi:predicted metal-dependent hydrolase